MTPIRKSTVTSYSTSIACTIAEVSLPCEPWNKPYVRPEPKEAVKLRPALPKVVDLPAALKMKASGMTARKIAKTLGCSEYAMTKALYKAGTEICAVPGCGARLAVANSTGRCRAHKWTGITEVAGPGAETKAGPA